ncbi:unnamed protein product [Rotaria magnacalcarata]|uniref:Uncharacterized protein n=2 Tax=Rotaria magnacalcarata TaxID=392030 RepID=A0A820DKY3_9BILA|nr:unnamed protein product [Rotaria magnacalcarata]
MSLNINYVLYLILLYFTCPIEMKYAKQFEEDSDDEDVDMTNDPENLEIPDGLQSSSEESNDTPIETDG